MTDGGSSLVRRSTSSILSCVLGGLLVLAGGLLALTSRSNEFETTVVFAFEPTTGVSGAAAEREFSEFAATQKLVITGRSVAQVAANRLNSDAHVMPGRRPLEPDHVREGLRVEPAGDSRTLAVHYRDSDPRVTTEVARAIAAAYLQQFNQLARVNDERASSELGANLNGSHTELRSFVAKHGATLTERQPKALFEELQRVQESLARVHIRIIELVAESRQLQNAVRNGHLHAVRIDRDEVVRDLRRREAELIVRGLHEDVTSALIAIRAEITTRAQHILDEAQAELDLVREEERQLSTAIAQVEQELIASDLRRMELVQAQRRADSEARLAGSDAQSAYETGRSWSARVVDPPSYASAVHDPVVLSRVRWAAGVSTGFGVLLFVLCWSRRRALTSP